MGLFDWLKGKNPEIPRLFVLSLDGVSHSFVLGAVKNGLMPNLGNILREGPLARMNSVLPTVSTVAWATYMTGVNPGKHGIFGYVDRKPNPFRAFIPTAQDLKAQTLWDIISKRGKRVGVMGVPLSYPPQKVNGFMVGCFLSPNLGQATYPTELAARLAGMDYRIDADLSLARQNLGAFLKDLNDTLIRRFEVAGELLRSEPWDFFQLHVMETDRINHFLWSAWEDRQPDITQAFEAFYRNLDHQIGGLTRHLPPETRLIILSDHGFTSCRAVVQINQWLEQNGYLHFGKGKKEFMNIHPETRAYSLVPGRVYLNLENREERGRVPFGRPAQDLREELAHRLGSLKDPNSGQPLIRRIYRREELYAGPYRDQAADLILEPIPGLELKAAWDAPALVGAPDLAGSHTIDDAFLFVQGAKFLPEDNGLSLLDLMPTLLTLLGLEPPQGLDGRSLA